MLHRYICFSWWWAHSRPKHVEKRNKHTKKNVHQVGFIYRLYRNARSTKHEILAFNVGELNQCSCAPNPDRQTDRHRWDEMILWVRSLGDSQRQPRELISGPSLGAKINVMSFNRTQSRAVIGLLTVHNTLRRHVYLLGLQDCPMCRKCGVMEETSDHILCESDALASLRHAYLGSFFLEPKDIQSISLGAICSFSKASGLPWLNMWDKGPALRPSCIGAVRSRTLDILILILVTKAYGLRIA